MTFTSVVVTAFDASGNFTQAVAELVPIDTTPPVIARCFTNLTLVADPLSCTAPMPDVTGTNFILATDNCADVIITQSIATNTPLALGTNVVVLTVVKGTNGVMLPFLEGLPEEFYTVSCTNTIVVVDQSPPNVLGCPSLMLSAGTNCMVEVPDVTYRVEATDCSLPLTTTQSPVAGAMLAVGAHPISFTITDAVGNMTNCTNTIIVRDNVPPVITSCAPNIRLTADEADAVAMPSVTNSVVASDDCGSITITQSIASGTLLPIGRHQVVLGVVDQSGNAAYCTNTVTVANAMLLSGLWVGKVQVTRVSDGTVNGFPSAPVASPFEFRVILHAISNATVQEIRLLKDVIAVQQRVGTNPPTVALVTDPALAATLPDAVRRDGRLVATRYASAAYDYEGFIPFLMPEIVGTSGFPAFTAGLLLGTNATSNPFKHKFHPDHRSGFAVGRTIALRFTRARNDPVREPPGYGTERMGGICREELTGLRSGAPLVVEGILSINRVHDSETLITGP